MKLSLISIASICISCFSFGSVPARADTMLHSMTTMPGAVPQTIDAATVEPAALSTQGSAADLLVEERSPSVPTSDRAEAFTVTADQINQNLADPPQQQENPLSALTERISLPQGMVVRGVNRGGIAVGSELPQ